MVEKNNKTKLQMASNHRFAEISDEFLDTVQSEY